MRGSVRRCDEGKKMKEMRKCDKEEGATSAATRRDDEKSDENIR